MMTESDPSTGAASTPRALDRLDAMLTTLQERKAERGDGRIFVWLREEKGGHGWFWWVCERIDPPEPHYRVIASYRHEPGLDAAQVLRRFEQEREGR